MAQRASSARYARTGDVDLSRARTSRRLTSRAWRDHGSARRARERSRLDARAIWNAMSILISTEDLLARRLVATDALAPLARGLRAELEPLIANPPEVPTLKAHLSRAGEADERFQLYFHQLWLAERVLHAALLAVLLDDRRARALASTMLDAYAD